MYKYFDIHSHLDFKDYESDIDEVVGRMKEKNIGTITIGTDYQSSARAVSLANKYENVWACIGIHPADGTSEEWNENQFEELVKNPKVVAVGECGLDFFHLPKEEGERVAEINRQKELFEKQIDFANKHKKVLMIHCRDSYPEVFEILESKREVYKDLKIHMHFFAGDLEVAKKFLELDATFSFTGVITFADQYNEVIKMLSAEKIMSETDAPFVAPVPYRGKRNEPSFVEEVCKKMAEIRGLKKEEMAEIILQNVKKVFNI